MREKRNQKGREIKGCATLLNVCTYSHKHTHLKNETILPANLLGRRVCLEGGRGEGGEGRGGCEKGKRQGV